MGCSHISKCVTELINKYKTNDPFKIAEYLGIEIHYKKLNSLKGFYTYMLRNKYIVINDELDNVSAKIVCAHEIGHDRFHRGLGTNMFRDEMCISYKTSTQEIEANRFAAELLISDYDFLRLASNDYTCNEMALELSVHSELIMIKAQILNSKGNNFNIPCLKTANYLAGK